MPFKLSRILTIQGGSVRVSLPRAWADANKLEPGSEVMIEYDETHLTIVPVKKEKAKN